MINPAGDTCKLYKGNPGDGNSRSCESILSPRLPLTIYLTRSCTICHSTVLAYTDTNAQGFQIFMAVSKGSRGLALTAGK